MMICSPQDVPSTTFAQHFMYSKSDGTIWTGGLNFDGQIGDGTSGNISRPTRVGSNFKSVETTTYPFHLALKQDGTLWHLGNSVIPTTQILSDVKKFSGNLILKNDGTLWQFVLPAVTGFIPNLYLDFLPTPSQIATDVQEMLGNLSPNGSLGGLYIKTDGTLWAVNTTGSATGQIATDVVGIYGAANSGSWYYKKADNSLWGGVVSFSPSPQSQPALSAQAVIVTPTFTLRMNNVQTVQSNLALKLDGTLWRLDGANVPIADGVQKLSCSGGSPCLVLRSDGLYTYNNTLQKNSDSRPEQFWLFGTTAFSLGEYHLSATKTLIGKTIFTPNSNQSTNNYSLRFPLGHGSYRPQNTFVRLTCC
jgi:hypothetical protein